VFVANKTKKNQAERQKKSKLKDKKKYKNNKLDTSG
tara:strand:- start:693 stop:800 length:108 start_codon:yes stop_codon:yes gene_type:complete